MPDPLVPQRLVSPSEFAAAIRKQHPGPYDSIPDDQLTHAVVKQYPEYGNRVVDVLGGAPEGVHAPTLPGGPGRTPGPITAAPPDPNSFMSTGDKVVAGLGDAAARTAQLAGNVYGVPGITTKPTLEDVPPFIQQPAMSPVTGTKKAVKGFSELINQPNPFKPGGPPIDVETALRPAADIVSGVMEAGELGLLPAAMAAPWATAASLAVGMGASVGITKIGQALDAPPALTELASDVGGLVAGGAVVHGMAKAEATGAAARTAGVNETIAGAEGIRADVAAQDASRANLDADAIAAGKTFEDAKTEAFNSLSINRGLIAAADAARQQGAGAKSPFDYLEMAAQEVRSSTAQLEAAQQGRAQQVIDPSLMLPPAPPEVLSEARRGPGEVPADRVGPEPPPVPESAPPVERAAPPPPPVDVPQGLPRGGPDDFFKSLDTETAIRQAEADRIARQRLAEQPNPGARLLPDRKFEAKAYSAEPRPIDEVGPPRVTKPALGPPPEPTSDPMVDRLVSEFESSLTPPTEDPAVIEARQRGEILRTIPEDMASSLEDNPHIQGGLVDSGTVEGNGFEGRRYQNATPAGQVFQDITKGAKTAPPVSLISDILRVYADTGAATSKDIPGARLLALRTKKGYGPRAFTNAYDRWMPEVIRVRDQMAANKFHQQRMSDAIARGAFGDRPGMGQLKPAPPPEPGLIGFDEGAPPMPPPDDMPEFLRNLEADPTTLGGFDEEQFPLPGAEGVRATENPTPEFEAPYSLTPEAPTGGGTPTGVQSSFWEALRTDAKRLASEEEGSLKFNVDPNDETAVRKWLTRKFTEYGDQPWHEAATQALEEGDLASATRIIDIANAQSYMADLAAARKDKERGPAAAKAAVLVADVVDQQKQKFKARFEAQLGIPLPKTVDVTPDGTMTFQPGGKGVPAIRVSATDRIPAATLLHDMTEGADATQIIRMGLSDEVPKEHQISSQVAQQILTEWPDDKVVEYAEFFGLDHLKVPEQRIELARNYVTGLSRAGKILGDLGNWTQRHADEFYNLVDVSGGSGENIASVMADAGIVDAAGFAGWVEKSATPEQLAGMGFQLPSGVDRIDPRTGKLTKGAKLYAENLFRKQERIHERQSTIARLVGEQGNALDRAVVGALIGRQSTGLRPSVAEGGTYEPGRFAAMNGLSKSAMISTPGNMIRNSISQAGRYASGMADEAMAATFSLLTGNTNQATYHARNLRYLRQGLTRKGTSSLNLFAHPWADGLEATYGITADGMIAAPPDSAWKTLGLLSEVPHQQARMLGALGMEETGPVDPGATSKYKALAAIQKGVDLVSQPAVRNTLTLFNRVQEHFWRASVFDSMLRAQIEAKGLDPTEMLAGDPRKLIDHVGAEEFDRMASAAVSSALDYTFAAQPLPGTAPAMLLDVLQKVPLISAAAQFGIPFPRFSFVSAPRWVWDHSPLAPVGDMILTGFSLLRSDQSQFGRGRYFQMLQNQRAEKTLLDFDMHLGRTRVDITDANQQFLAAKEKATQARQTLRGIEKRAASERVLPEVQADVDRIKAQLEEYQTAAVTARAEVKKLEARAKNLTTQRDNAYKNINSLGEVGAAKSPQEYFARVATGTAMMAAGWAMWKYRADHSTTPGSPDTQWYEFPLSFIPKGAREAIGIGDDEIVDTRSYAPQVQQLFLPDVLADVHAHTDWSQFDSEKLKSEGPRYLSEFMKVHYTGKYTGEKFTKDALEAYLTMTPASGSTRELLDIIEGKSQSGLDFGAVQDSLLSMAGQYIGRYATPISPINDIMGQINPEDAKARIPAEGTPETHSITHELLDPTLSRIPVARRSIPEKTDALTGNPVASVDPAARQFLGITKRLTNRLQQEMNATGISYSQLVPRQTGDREFDNAVNRHFAQIANETLPQLLDDPTYQAATPEIKRDFLVNGWRKHSAIFAKVKAGAVAAAIDELGKDPAMMKSPNARAKIERWLVFADQLEKELAPALAADKQRKELESAEEDQAEPQEEPEPGAPPAVPRF